MYHKKKRKKNLEEIIIRSEWSRRRLFRPDATWMDLRRQTEKKEVFASGSDTGNDVTSFKKGFPVPDVRFNKARRMPDEWQKCRAIVI